MFRMLTCFNLDASGSIDEFSTMLDRFSGHMIDLDLVHGIDPIGRRQRDTIMDTDDERDHEFFFLMSFRDRAQCDRAIEHIYAQDQPADSIHKAVYSRIKDQIFICWEDIQYDTCPPA